jgi:hypothetical protein
MGANPGHTDDDIVLAHEYAEAAQRDWAQRGEIWFRQSRWRF